MSSGLEWREGGELRGLFAGRVAAARAHAEAVSTAPALGAALRTTLRTAPAPTAAATAASLPRARHGLHLMESRAPEQPLELYSFEASPFARLVRERLERSAPAPTETLNPAALSSLPDRYDPTADLPR